MEIKNVWSLSLYTSQSSKEQAWPEALLLHCMYILRWWRSLSYSLSLSTLYRHTSQNEMVKTIVISIVGEMCTRQRRWSYLSKENISIMQCDQTFISWCSKENFITIIITDIMTYLRCKTNLTRTKQSLRNNEIRYLIGYITNTETLQHQIALSIPTLTFGFLKHDRNIDTVNWSRTL